MTYTPPPIVLRDVVTGAFFVGFENRKPVFSPTRVCAREFTTLTEAIEAAEFDDMPICAFYESYKCGATLPLYPSLERAKEASK